MELTSLALPTLVVIVNNRRDWARVQDEGWYRIPVGRSPQPVAAWYLAFYFTRWAKAEAWQIMYYAPVQSYSLVRRRELLPGEAQHARADDLYFRIALGSIQALPQPVPSRRLRRITFIPTTLAQLAVATDVTELWRTDDQDALLWTYFRDAALKATRRLALEEEPGPGRCATDMRERAAFCCSSGAIPHRL